VQSLHHYAAYPGYLVVTKTVAQVSAFVGVVAALLEGLERVNCLKGEVCLVLQL